MISALIDSAANQKTLASPKSVTELFYEHGILVNPNVNKDILSGISQVKSFLKNIDGKTRLYIFSSCKNLIQEFKTYRWNGEDSPIKKDDHALDELRYYIMHLNKFKNITNYETEIQKHKKLLYKNLRHKN